MTDVQFSVLVVEDLDPAVLDLILHKPVDPQLLGGLLRHVRAHRGKHGPRGI
jgi:hypothetical protein